MSAIWAVQNPLERKCGRNEKPRAWHRAGDTQVVGDGAVWIWNLVADYFYDAHQVVDWYHATEHLAIAAHLAFGEGTPEASRWFKQQETPLFQGHADRIAQTILSLAMTPRKEELQQQAGYFSHYHHRMQYMNLRSDGWVIGSGMVESGGRRFHYVSSRWRCRTAAAGRPATAAAADWRGEILTREVFISIMDRAGC